MNGDALVKKTTKIMFGDAGISGTAQYMSQLVWVLFLKVFDYKEEEWELEGDYAPVIPAPFRFRDWADPRNEDGSKDYSNRITGDKLINFVNNTLFPYLRGIEVEYGGKKILFSSEDSKAKIIRSFMAESQNYMKDGVRLRQLINEIADVDFDVASQKHDFNEFYERLLKELQNGGKATGEFYTPRALTQFIVDHVNPQIGEKIADFACGTGGFLADAVSHIQKQAKSVDDALTIQDSIYGIEWKQLPYMLCVTNMYLHNIDDPNIVHGDGLAKDVLDLADDDLFDCIIMNPPFGGEFNKADLKNFPDEISSSESADLFVARIIYCLKKNGRCGLVLPDGLLFNTDQSKTNLKRLLMTECNLHTIIRLPGSVFAPYTGINTNLLFFEKTGKTKEVWFYRMDMPEGRKHFNKTHPISRDDLDIIDKWWNNRREIKDEKEDPSMAETWKAKRFTFDEIERMEFNLDLCGFPEDEEIVLVPEETISSVSKSMDAVFSDIKNLISAIQNSLKTGDSIGCNNSMLHSCFKLSEIVTDLPNKIRKSILQYAMQGKLVEQIDSDESVDLLCERIQERKNTLIKEGIIRKEKPLAEIDEDDIPFEIPNTWKWVRLRDVCTKIVDGDHNPPAGVGHKTEWLMLSAQNINNNRIVDIENARYLSKEVYDKEHLRTRVQKGDIFFTIVGTLGRSCVFDEDINVTFQRSVSVISTEIYNKYLKYVLDSPYIQQYMVVNATGTAQKGFYLKQVENLIIPLPPLEEQVRIVEKLESILTAVEGNSERI
ncbi:N-6 DNA methylase [Butyrivibrio sp. FC2001]|uniref:N-6 DNA methylase n=1 Tax=Butyrivibrio sp. FC2001 TaxID=1280671 RepID=UPI00040A8285|nr:N-6 DNA methylase [Butyrivibrio sp. FC2001]